MAEEIKVFLGTELIGSKETEPVYWYPKRENNPHMILAGGSGSGKTETLKSIIFELKKQKVNSLIIDFHDDFQYFSDNLIDLDKSKANLHPLEILPGEKPKDVAYRVATMFTNIFRLGSIQQAILVESIKQFYVASKIINLDKKIDYSYNLLNFSLLQKIISDQTGDTRALLAKLNIVFDTDLFVNDTADSVSFDDMLTKTTVLTLNEYATDGIKALIAEIILRKLINYLYISGKSSELRLFCIIDEAHRLTYDGSPIDQILKESRKYGLGMVLASQRPVDFSDDILANTSTKLGFKADIDKDAVFLSKIYQIDKSHFKNILHPGSGYSIFSSDNVTRHLQIFSVDNRPGYKELIKHFDRTKNSEYFESKVKIEQDKQKTLENLEFENKQLNQLIKKQDQLIKTKEKEVIDLENELDTKTSLLKNYKEKIAILDKEKTNLEDLVSNQEKVISKRNKDLSEKNDKVKECELKLDELTEYKSLYLNQEKVLSKQEKELKENASKIKQFELQLNELDDFKYKLKELSTVNQNLDNYIKNITYLLSNERRTSTVLDNIEKLEDIDLTKKIKYCFKCHSFVTSADKFCKCCGEKV